MLTITLLSTLVATFATAAFEQTPLQQDGKDAAHDASSRRLKPEGKPRIELQASDVDVVHELKKAEIIPTVFNTFEPLFTLNIAWENETADYGNTINPSKAQDSPSFSLQCIDGAVGAGCGFENPDVPQLTIAMTDPDAPSRDNPEWSEICHWIASIVHDAHSGNEKLKTTMPYKAPGPPPKTGKHRYVFVVLAPFNETTETLHLSKPDDRQHWGFKHERQGLRKWAEENGLGVVGANFVYAQNEEQ